MLWCGQPNRLQIARLNQQVHYLPISVWKVENDPSCCLFYKKSTVHMSRLFTWSCLLCWFALQSFARLCLGLLSENWVYSHHSRSLHCVLEQKFCHNFLALDITTAYFWIYSQNGFAAKGLYNNCQMWILGPCISSSSKSLEVGLERGLLEPVIRWRFYRSNLFHLIYIWQYTI